jgi:hypothetical protein
LPTDALSADTLLADGANETEPSSQRTPRRLTGESKTGESPETPSVVYGARKPKPANRVSAKLLIAYAHMRTASPSTRSCPASGSASSFLPASALARHEAFRPPGGQDARCVQPTSATQSNCVYPYLVRSRPAVATFAAWAPYGVLGSVRYCRGKGRFTSPATASVDRSGHHPVPRIVSSRPRLVRSPRGDRLLRAWALSSHGAWSFFDRASDTPVASPSSAVVRVTFVTLRFDAFASSLVPS